jgi:CheY-like chemotaxis protein
MSDGENRGASFTVRIPELGARALMEQPSLAPIEGPLDAARAGALDQLTVLVVDDDADARDLISTALRHAGAHVMAAASVRDALDILQTTTPHAIVSDIAMPNGTGYDLARQIRSMPQTAQIPAIALTAYGRPEDRERALSVGFNFHIVKPVEPLHLVHAVAAAVGRA